MKKKLKFISILFLVIGLVLFSDYIRLKNEIIDGDGVGILFCGLIGIILSLFGADEKVPYEQVPAYAKASLIASLLFIATALYTLYRTFKSFKQ
ncbi:MAG: hypothetical protein HPY74_19835 [Firmicutes bacterium]|nr:hypothetical protein [Bacillota bacterium]